MKDKKELRDCAEALVRWFRSQDITTDESLMVMGALMELILEERNRYESA